MVQPIKHLKPIHPRHHDVENEHIGGLVYHRLKDRFPILGHEDLVALFDEAEGKKAADGHVVIRYVDACH